MVLDKQVVIAATEQKIIELANEVALRISLVRTEEQAEVGAQLCKILRVIENPYSVLTYNEVQLLLQMCINLGVNL